MLAGARGFVTKPLQPDELVTSLRQVVGRQPATGAMSGDSETAPGRSVIFCAPKGGTGRTTLAINTAISLQKPPASRSRWWTPTTLRRPSTWR